MDGNVKVYSLKSIVEVLFPHHIYPFQYVSNAYSLCVKGAPAVLHEFPGTGVVEVLQWACDHNYLLLLQDQHVTVVVCP